MVVTDRQSKTTGSLAALSALSSTSPSVTAALDSLATVGLGMGDDSLDAFIDDILLLLADSLDVGMVFQARVDGDVLVFERTSNRAGMNLSVGARVPLRDTYCSSLIESSASHLIVEDAYADPEFADRPVTHEVGIGAYSGVPLYDPDGALYGTLCTLHPQARVAKEGEVTLLSLAGRIIMQALALSHARQRERLLRQAELVRVAQLRAVVAQMPAVLFALDHNGVFTLCEGQALSSLGLLPSQLVGLSIYDVFRDAPGMIERFRGVLSGEDSTTYDEINDIVYETRWVAVRDGDGSISGLIILGTDVTERRQIEEDLKRRALHDDLTGLPNRALFYDRLAHHLRTLTRYTEPLALLLIDLDGFKLVNDRYGHAIGDLLLQQVAARLNRAVRAADTVSRLGGDEFGVLLSAGGRGGAILVAERIASALREPIPVDSHHVMVGASIGIAIASGHENDATTLLRCADRAMYEAKAHGGGYRFYSTKQDGPTLARLAMERDLRGALQEQQFILAYQPVIDLNDGRLCRMKAVLYWQHPVHGLLSSERFAGTAESIGLLAPILTWALDDALAQYAQWHQQGVVCGVCMAISPRTLGDEAFYLTTIDALARHNLSAPHLTLTIPEIQITAADERGLAAMATFRSAGVRLALDNFGTGNTVLFHLKELPIDEIILDRSLVRSVTDGGVEALLLCSAIGISRGLALDVTAEGVEDAKTWDLLAGLGTLQATGHYLCPPSSAQAVLARLAERQALWEDHARALSSPSAA